MYFLMNWGVMMDSQYNKLLSCIKKDSPEDGIDYLYQIDDKGVVIEGYIGRRKNLVVPENIDNRPVYKINDNAFYEDEKLKKITLPNNLEIIGKEAFSGSTIESATLPESLLIIEDGAFADSSLKSVNLPDSISIIGEKAFSGTDITSIAIPRSVISIGARAFEYTNISSIKIPSNVKSISEEMFNNCKELHSVIIEGAETIEESAFDGCEILKNISLPDTLSSIEDRAFNGTGIEYLIVPQSVDYIGADNFPKHSHIAILSDETAFYLGDSDYADYSSVTLYCNQSNKNARAAAKEFGMTRKSLATFAQESANYYKMFESDSSMASMTDTTSNAPLYEASTKIEDLNLAIRAYNCLKRAGVNTLEDLTNMTWGELRAVRNLGRGGAEHVEQILKSRGLSLKVSEPSL